MNNKFVQIQDMTATEELESLRNILDNIPALVYINELERPDDPTSLKNIYLNRFGHDMIGYTRKEINEMGSQFFSKIIHPDDMEIIPTTVVASYYQSYLVSMHRLRSKNKLEYKWFYDHGCTIKTFEDGSPKQALVIAVEVTDTMHTHNQLNSALKEISQLKYALKLSRLTTREKEVLHLIAKGKTDKEISTQLFISIQTAKKHRNNLILKTEVVNTAELVALAVEAGEY
jgi:DNA-binding CsgD family transcriptional regulator